MIRIVHIALLALALALGAPAPNAQAETGRARQPRPSKIRPKPRAKPAKTRKKARRPRAADRRPQILKALGAKRQGRLYRAAKTLIAGRGNPFRGITPTQRKQLRSSLQKALRPAGKKPLSKTIPALQRRSGAATLTLALAEASTVAQGRHGLLDLYLQAMEREPDRGLRDHMYMNLAERQPLLSRTQKGRFGKLRDRVLPPKPPYKKWFSKRKKLQVRHYVHQEFWQDELTGYRQKGWKLKPRKDGAVVATHKLEDPSGQHAAISARVVLRKTEDRVFRDMADPDVNIEIYSGHSELGGNVSHALSQGPKKDVGEKLITTFMCRGKQNLDEIARRYPRAQILTTEQASLAHQDIAHAHAIYDGIARRATYREMSKAAAYGGKKNYIFPDDPRQLAYRDLDRDGSMDPRRVGSPRHRERLYTVERRIGRGGQRTLRPGKLPKELARVDGQKVTRAVNFANTLFAYHVEYNPRGAPRYAKKRAGERFVARGWFKGKGDEVIRVQPRRHKGEAFFEVQVNARYANTHADVLGPAVIFELNNFLARHHYGAKPAQEKARSLGFAGAYIEYMVFDEGLARDALRSLTRKYGLPDVKPAALSRAINSDGDGFGTAKIVREVRKEIALAGGQN